MTQEDRLAMDEIISAAAANRQLSRVLRGAREGRSFLVTSHGKPVARITPYDQAQPAMMAIRAELLDRLSETLKREIERKECKSPDDR